MDCTIHPIHQAIVNCFLVRHEGAILVDSGMPGKADAVLAAAAGLGLRPQDIRLIVLTHGHWDHAANAAELASRTGAAIALHQAEAQLVERGQDVPVVPVTAWGRFIAWSLGMGLIKTMLGARMKPFAPGIRLGDADMALAEYGIPGRIVATPGHTSGSVSVVLDDGRALVGCAAMNGLPSISGRPVLPIFAQDTGALATSWRRLFALGVHTAFPAHGGPFPAEVMRSQVGA